MPPPRYSARPFPPYRFVPGRSPHPTRDPQGHSFGEPDPPETIEPDAWHDREGYLFAIDLFNYEYWWEAHEALEPMWLAAGRTTNDGLFVQGLIQVSAALLKHSMGVVDAARRKGADGCAKLRTTPTRHFGIDVPDFTRQVTQYLAGTRRAVPVVRLAGVARLLESRGSTPSR